MFMVTMLRIQQEENMMMLMDVPIIIFLSAS